MGIMTRRSGTKAAALLCVMLVFGTVMLGVVGVSGKQAAASPLVPPVVLADAADNCTKGLFGLKPWYYYMPKELGVNGGGPVQADPCGVRCFNIFVQSQKNDCGQTNSDIPGVILAIIDDLLRIAGLVAVAFIIVGSFQYVGSRGNSERTAQAQSTIISALIGLAIAIAAIGVIAFLGNQLQ